MMEVIYLLTNVDEWRRPFQTAVARSFLTISAMRTQTLGAQVKRFFIIGSISKGTGSAKHHWMRVERCWNNSKREHNFPIVSMSCTLAPFNTSHLPSLTISRTISAYWVQSKLTLVIESISYSRGTFTTREMTCMVGTLLADKSKICCPIRSRLLIT